MQVVSSLLPIGSHANDSAWVLFELHESTDGIFELIAAMAAEAGFTRSTDPRRGNVFARDGVEYVGYWTTIDSLDLVIDQRQRGFKVSEFELLGSFDPCAVIS